MNGSETKPQMALFEKVKADLVDRLSSASFDSGESIGSERELIQTYGVSRITIRRALKDLENEGVINRIPGKGTFVRQMQQSTPKSQGNLLAIFREDYVYDDEFFREIYQGVLQEAHRLGYHVISGHAASDAHSLEMARGLLAEYKPVSCLLLVRAPGKFIRATGIDLDRTVIVDDELDVFGRKLPSIMGDNSQGAADMMQHLLSLGHRKIAFLSITQAVSTTSINERANTWRAAVMEVGDEHPIFLEWDGIRGASGQALLEQIKQLSPTAVFCANDYLAASLLTLFRDAGVRVPDDCSVAGFDGIQVAEQLGLTTVAIPMRQMGAVAVKRAVNLLQGTDFGPATTAIPVQLVVRTSTAAPGSCASGSLSGRSMSFASI
ncbi:MAG: GntR family transcriptional regulator [Capsulimonadaceae bacterium]|nr:GntR family transcriptional regulator [Capsulimonadaceae bacterium]